MVIDIEQQLVEEIGSIISSVYPVALKKLQLILQDVGDNVQGILLPWTVLHPSQTTVLARAVLDGLTIWPYTLDVLQRLSTVAPFRNALLLTNPLLLAQSLEKAISKQEDFDRFSGLCVQLLSDPLPAQVALPASAQSFLWRLFEAAVQRPSAQSVDPVYLLLDGACGGLLEILPQSGLQKLHAHLTKMMRSVQSIEEQPLSLYCLAIIAKLDNSESARHTVKQDQWQQTSTSIGSELRKFFIGDRAPKTIQLLALQVIYACKTGPSIISASRIRLARQILLSIHPELRENWSRTNRATLGKIYEKTAQCELSGEVKLEALAFAVLLSDSSTIPSSAVAEFQRTLLVAPYAGRSRYLHESILTAAPLFTSLLDETFWQNFFQLVLFTVIRDSDERTCQSKQLELILHILKEPAMVKDSARGVILKAVSTNKICHLLKDYLARHNSSRLNLQAALCSFLLVIAVRGSTGTSDMIKSLSLQLISKLSSLSGLKASPEEAPRKITNLFAQNPIIEQACTPIEDHGASHHWRQRLTSELGQDAKQRVESVTQLISHVCQDLEYRCNNIEAPLRKEQERTKQLQLNKDEMQGVIRGLETQHSELLSELADAEAGRAQEASNVSAALSELEDAMARCAHLEQRLESAGTEACSILETTRRDFEAQVLELETNLACQTEKADGHEDRVKHVMDELDYKKMSMEGMKQQYEASMRSRDKTIRALEIQVSTGSEALQCRDTVVHEISDRANALAEQIAELQEQLRVKEAECQELLRQQRETAEAIERDVSMLKTKHKSEVEAITAKARSDMYEHEGRLAKCTREYNNTVDEFKSELSLRAQENDEIREQAQELENELQMKAQQLRDAQKMKSRLMTALGLEDAAGTSSPQKTGTSARRTVINSVRRDNKTIVSGQNDGRQNINKAQKHHFMSSVVGAASPSQSPSPKRPRPRAMAKGTTAKHATFAIGTNTSTGSISRVVSSRRSLGVLGPTHGNRLNLTLNRRRPETPTCNETSNSRRTDEEMEVDDEVKPIDPSASPLATSGRQAKKNRTEMGYGMKDDSLPTTAAFCDENTTVEM